MKTQTRIVFACFTGAALGALIALQLHYFWWVGILIGAATGYLAFSFEQVLTAVAAAWRTLPASRLGVGELKAGLLNLVRFLAVLTCIVFCAASILALSVGGLMFVAAGPEPSSTWEAAPAVPEPMPIPNLFWVIASAGVIVLAGVLAGLILQSKDRKGTIVKMLCCIAATPLVLPITLLVVLLSAVVPRAVRAAVRIGRHTFVLIHSEIRLLCLTDALIGALVGYVCGNALIGGGIGAVLGWVNYRFVSVRWLKLAKI